MKLAKMRIVVVLPAPLGPRNPMISPRLTSKFKSRIAGWPAYRFVRFSTLIISQYFHETTEPRLRCRFFLTRRHAQSGELPALSARTDYANGEFEFRAAPHTSEQFLDLLDGVRFGVARPINYQAALKPCFICRAIWFDCSNQNAASSDVT